MNHKSHEVRMFWLSILAMAVSISHAASTLLLWGGEPHDKIFNFLMVLTIDATIWIFSEYVIGRRMAKKKVGGWVNIAFLLSLLIAFGLNGAFMFRFMPSSIHPIFAMIISASLAIFVPVVIIATGNARAELDADLRNDLAQSNATKSALDAERAKRDALVAQYAAQIAELNALLEERAITITELETRTSHLLSDGGNMMIEVGGRFKIATRELERVLQSKGISASESSLRNWLAPYRVEA